MNIETAQILCKLNNDFYQKHCDSFSETRKAPWEGWKKAVEILNPFFKEHHVLSVFDLACGNLRFESFLAAALPDTTIEVYATDNCDELVFSTNLIEEGESGAQTFSINFQSLDVLQVLLENTASDQKLPDDTSAFEVSEHGFPYEYVEQTTVDKGDNTALFVPLTSNGSEPVVKINNHFEAPHCDLSVSFGFMHHVPLRQFREEVLTSLVEQTCSGGYVVVSFWQFMNNENMAEKARVTHEQALRELNLPPLDEHDYLLGWKNIPGEYRYCHSFSETEIDALIDSTAERAELVARFVSDGRTGNLNTYVILKVL